MRVNETTSGARGCWSAVLVVLALGMAACGERELPPCDAPERQAQAARVDSFPAAARDSIVRAFTSYNRIRDVSIRQADCHLRATVQVDSLASARYASTQGFALLRALKAHAPNETRPITEDPASEVGIGLYDYAVTFERPGMSDEAVAPREREGKAWMRLSKSYDDRRVTVRR